MNVKKCWKLGALLLAAGTAQLPSAAAPKDPVTAPMTKPIASRVTSYVRMTSELRADAAASPLLTLASIGKSTHGKTLWLMRAGEPAVASEKTVRVLFLCRQHGDEPASTEAVLGLLSRLAHGKEPELRAQLRQTTFYFVPMVNPDGADANTRRNGVGADLNRDWGAFAQPETRAVHDVAQKLSPHVVIDAHNWDGDDPYNANCIEADRDRESEIAGAARETQSAAAMALSRLGFQINATAYGPQADPRLAHRYFTSQNLVSLLVETHSGDPGDVSDFVRRQGVYVGLIHALGDNLSASGTLARLDGLENRDDSREAQAGVADRKIFAVSKTAAAPVAGRPARRAPRWLPVVLAFAVALWALFQGRAVLDSEPPAPRYRFCRKSWLRNVPGSRVAAVAGIRPAAARGALRSAYTVNASNALPARRELTPDLSERRRDSSTPRTRGFARASAAPSDDLHARLLCLR
ncbi:hypothetical protein CCAX7_24750 [Capsulimonas corticalis]|uniref:Peptidase M14 domain-containing protein n=1 Tax=Capsulimonas corticalis TaxID=2219043 RepID=A0A402CVJ6_9BACT|nr:M14 family zinc carboxypeptidase [Capsulimonas corticalis]BDI30424.1 hypothetical protein CCAX7_24750 [Capsulimonas corticalis]